MCKYSGKNVLNQSLLLFIMAYKVGVSDWRLGDWGLVIGG